MPGRNATERRGHEKKDAYISSTIPPNITEIFGDGRADMPTVAAMLDIQYRTYIIRSDDSSDGDPNDLSIDQGRPRSEGHFRMYQSLILDYGYSIVEGLVVDTIDGGIGFRNHTVPANPGNGSEWEEDLLFLEPETVCVPANLTLHYTLSEGGYAEVLNLVDEGGFANAPTSEPMSPLPDDLQANPRPRDRAQSGAILNNHNIMKYLNLSPNDSLIHRSYELPDTTALDPQSIDLTIYSSWSKVPGYPQANRTDNETYFDTGEKTCHAILDHILNKNRHNNPRIWRGRRCEYQLHCHKRWHYDGHG